MDDMDRGGAPAETGKKASEICIRLYLSILAIISSLVGMTVRL
mgnify:FL=1|jgi:hypothetical protein